MTQCETWDWPSDLLHQRFPLSNLSSSQPVPINFRFGNLRVDTSIPDMIATKNKLLTNSPITAFFTRTGTNPTSKQQSLLLWNQGENNKSMATVSRIVDQDDDESQQMVPLKSFAEMIGITKKNPVALEEDDEEEGALTLPPLPAASVIMQLPPVPQTQNAEHEEEEDSDLTQPPYPGAPDRDDFEMEIILSTMQNEDEQQLHLDTTEATNTSQQDVVVATPLPSPFLPTALYEDSMSEEPVIVRRRPHTVVESDDEHLKESVDNRPAAEKRKDRKKTLDARAKKNHLRRYKVDIATAVVASKKRESDSDKEERKVPCLHPSGIDEYDSDDEFMEKDDEYRSKIEHARKYALKNGVDLVKKSLEEEKADRAMIHHGVVDSDEERDRFKAEYGEEALNDDKDSSGESLDDSGETSDSEMHEDDSATTRSRKQRAAIEKSVDKAEKAKRAEQAAIEAAKQEGMSARAAAISDAHTNVPLPIQDTRAMINEVYTLVGGAIEMLTNQQSRDPAALRTFVTNHVAANCSAMKTLVGAATSLAMPIVDSLNKNDPMLATVLRATFLDPTASEIQYGPCDQFVEHSRDFNKKAVCTLCCDLITPPRKDTDPLICFRVLNRSGPYKTRFSAASGSAVLCSYARYYIEAMTNLRRINMILCSTALGYMGLQLRDHPDKPLPDAFEAETIDKMVKFIEANWSMLNGLHASLIRIN